MMTDPVTRGEFDMVARRVEQIDSQGTRGVAGVAIELGHLKTDLAELKAEMVAHDRRHDDDRAEAERRVTTARRFRVGASAAWLASVAALIGLLIDIASKIN